MSDTVFVRPAPGARVRLPGQDFAPIPPEGREVPRDTFVLRRIADGDLIEGKPKTPAPAAKPAASQKEG